MTRFGLVTLAVVLAGLLVLDPAARPTGLLRDFNAFYCAGAAVAHGADPYLAEPLGSCERAPQPEPLAFGRAGLAVPAPLPPYALAPFALLSLLPYPVAAALWCGALLLALAIAILALRRATNLPLAALAAALALSDGYVALDLGQIAPLAVAALALATMYAARGNDRVAGWAAACAMIEPHIGLPACLALFIWRRQARLPLILAALIFTGLSLWLVGTATALEYGRAVVPAHALSELTNEKQFSVSYLAHRLGAGDELALRLGTLSYLATLALGCAIAGPLAERLRASGLIVAVPAAVALVGGPFSHIAQMPAALPCALVFAARVPSLRRALTAVVTLLAIPWVQFTTLGTLFGILAAIVTVVVGRALGRMRALDAGIAAFAALAFIALLLALVRTPVPNPDVLLAAAYDPHALAEASWGLYVQTVAHANLLAYDLARVPTLAALLALGWIAVMLAARALPPDQNFAPSGNGSTGSGRNAP